MEHNTIALVTGATSGLGFEAAAQLAHQEYTEVVVTGRSHQTAGAAVEALEERTGLALFTPLVVDFNEPQQVADAVDQLANAGVSIGSLLLNAGMVSGSSRIKTSSGVEITMASSLIGHHQFTLGLLDRGVLSPHASIVIAGSEAARGDVPTFKPTDLGALADKHFGGDLVAAADGIIKGDDVIKYKPATAYADAKAFVAMWAAELADRLPDGMTVNAVSPGSAPDTRASRNAAPFMKYVMLPVFKLAPKRMGMSAPVAVAARRYIDVLDRDDVSGEFFASAPGKMTGPIEPMDLPHIKDEAARKASWDAVVAVTGGVDYQPAA